MRHIFIVNPRAGKADATGRIRQELARLREECGYEAELYVTEYPRHAAQLAAQLCEQAGTEAVRFYACGGDGTLSEVADGAAGHANAEVTHVPCGTGNDFIRIFGGGRERFHDLRALMEGEALPIDTMRCAGRQPINICSVGLDAKIADGMRHFRKGPSFGGVGPYICAFVGALATGFNADYCVEIDGRPYHGRYALVLAANGRYYGGGFYPVPEAMPDDGVLEFLLVRAVTVFTVAAVVGAYKAGRHAELPQYVTWVRGREMRIARADGKNMPVNMDGEIIYEPALEITLGERQLLFAAPKGAAWR